MNKNIAKKIETVDELIDHLTRYAAAYRKSYKLCGRVNTSLQILAGIFGCSAALALVPVIPIFVATVGAVPATITILLNKLKLVQKRDNFKQHYIKIKVLLSQVNIDHGKKVEDSTTISNTFSELKTIEKENNYSPPLETYMKEFKLNGYE